jgi:hypothetical protein
MANDVFGSTCFIRYIVKLMRYGVAYLMVGIGGNLQPLKQKPRHLGSLRRIPLKIREAVTVYFQFSSGISQGDAEYVSTGRTEAALIRTDGGSLPFPARTLTFTASTQ